MRGAQRPQRADRIDEQRVRPVEGVDIPAAGDVRPAPRLDRAAELQGQFVEVPLPCVFLDPPLVHQPQQVAVRADVVEAVVVNADVAHVRRHLPDRVPPADLQKSGVARGVELQHGRSVLKALRPLRPPPRRIDSLHRENRRPLLGIVRLFDRGDFRRRKAPQAFDLGQKLLGPQ